MPRTYEHVDLEMRFWTKVLPVESGCWEWQGTRDADGYGRIWNPPDRRALAHRVSYGTFVGCIPLGCWVLHSCDNPSCVRPGHLFLGTVADNNSDMAGKGRARNQHSGQTHCKRGHAFTPDNTYTSKGKRCCRTCCIGWHRGRAA